MASPLTSFSTNQNDKAPKNKHHSTARRKRKEKQQRQPPLNDDFDDDEQRLMSTLFGTPKNESTASNTNSKNLSNKKKRLGSTKNEIADEFTFKIDRIGGSIPSDDLETTDHDPNDQLEEMGVTTTNSTATATASNSISKKKDVAWVDHDDSDDDENGGEKKVNFGHASDRIRKLRQYKEETHVPTRSLYEERLRQRYIQTTQTTSNVAWAQTTMQDDAGIVDDYHHNTPKNHPDVSISTSYLNDPSTTSTSKMHHHHHHHHHHRRAIPPHIISMKRCPDVNRNDPNQSVTKVVQFYHPAAVTTNTPSMSRKNEAAAEETTPNLLLTAGLDKTLRFFHCSEESSTKIHGVHCTLDGYTCMVVGCVLQH